MQCSAGDGTEKVKKWKVRNGKVWPAAFSEENEGEEHRRRENTCVLLPYAFKFEDVGNVAFPCTQIYKMHTHGGLEKEVHKTFSAEGWT